MKKYKVTYTPDKTNYYETIVEATSYTYALLAFVIKFPTAYYTEVQEVTQ